VLYGGEVGGSVIGSDAAIVIAKDTVQRPVEAIFHGLVISDVGADLARAFDHDEGVQAGPLVLLLQPADVLNDGDISGLDAPVIPIDRLVARDDRVFEILGFLFGCEEFRIVPQRALISLEGEDVVGLLILDSGRYRADSPWRRWSRQHLRCQHVQLIGDGDDLVSLLGDLDLPQHQTLARCEGRDHKDRRIGLAF
jgi:hypothetical protein